MLQNSKFLRDFLFTSYNFHRSTFLNQISHRFFAKKSKRPPKNDCPELYKCPPKKKIEDKCRKRLKPCGSQKPTCPPEPPCIRPCKPPCCPPPKPPCPLRGECPPKKPICPPDKPPCPPKPPCTPTPCPPKPPCSSKPDPCPPKKPICPPKPPCTPPPCPPKTPCTSKPDPCPPKKPICPPKPPCTPPPCPPKTPCTSKSDPCPPNKPICPPKPPCTSKSDPCPPKKPTCPPKPPCAPTPCPPKTPCSSKPDPCPPKKPICPPKPPCTPPPCPPKPPCTSKTDPCLPKKPICPPKPPSSSKSDPCPPKKPICPPKPPCTPSTPPCPPKPSSECPPRPSSAPCAPKPPPKCPPKPSSAPCKSETPKPPCGPCPPKPTSDCGPKRRVCPPKEYSETQKAIKYKPKERKRYSEKYPGFFCEKPREEKQPCGKPRPPCAEEVKCPDFGSKAPCTTPSGLKTSCCEHKPPCCPHEPKKCQYYEPCKSETAPSSSSCSKPPVFPCLTPSFTSDPSKCSKPPATPCSSPPAPSKCSKSPCPPSVSPSSSKPPCSAPPAPPKSTKCSESPKSPCSKPAAPPKSSKPPCSAPPTPSKCTKSPCPPSVTPSSSKCSEPPKSPCSKPSTPPKSSKSPCSPPSPPPSSQKCVSLSPAIKDKVAIITGGSVGIGYYCALAILRNGGKVMLGDVKIPEGQKAICDIVKEFGHDKAAFMKCDVKSPKDMECLFKATMCEFKKVDIVINNAGILKDKYWRDCIDINVKGLIHGTLLGFHYMRRNKEGGNIINVASILGHQPFHGCPIYTGTKHFVVGFTRSMGHEYYFNQTGVKVMTLCPGVTITSMVEDSDTAGQLEGFGDVGRILHTELHSLPTQSGEVCGGHIVPILEAGINGSDWISEGNEVYRVRRVDRLTLRVKDGDDKKCKQKK